MHNFLGHETPGAQWGFVIKQNRRTPANAIREPITTKQIMRTRFGRRIRVKRAKRRMLACSLATGIAEAFARTRIQYANARIKRAHSLQHVEHAGGDALHRLHRLLKRQCH